MDIDVVGRHALLFDDDTTAAFVNSNDALVEWNSLLIDRYDVRHLLSSPPPPRRRRNMQQTHLSSSSPSLSSLDSELDHERYLDLPSPSDEQESDESAKTVTAGGFNAVPFSYGTTEDSNDQKNAESGLECAGFHPPFPVPDSLIQNLPPTEKVHQIIARTALFVSKHGGQSEIVLRVKQGANPTFGFLIPDHHLHSYFRFLVDHQELLQSNADGKPENEEKISNNEHASGVGALSLLGSLYGTGEDEDGAAEYASASKENLSGKTLDVSATVSLVSEKTESLLNTAGKDEAVSKHGLTSKEEASALRKNTFVSAFKSGNTGAMKKGEFSGSLSAAPNKLRASSLPPISKSDHLLLEPPSDIKRLIDKIVEFIMKNGKEFEAVLVEQDREHGRFPFLMPSNQYHPYYLKVLHKAQESKLIAKSSVNEKDGLVGHLVEKKISLSKESDTLFLDSCGYDIPYDSDRKEKFKMVIGKSKKDGADLLSKPSQQQLGVRVDAAQAAAILQAATRGIKNPNLGILSNSSLNGKINGPSSESGQPSSLGSLHSSQPESVSVPMVMAIAKTAAIEAASEADSSDAHLTREQKLKAERLKRAKMFMAMLKSSAAPSQAEPLRGLSAEPQESGPSGFGAEINLASKEREGSSAPLDVDASDKIVTTDMEHFNDECNERRSRRKYRSRSSRHEEDEAGEEDDDDDGGDEKRVHKHSRKKPRSRRSSLEDDNGEEKNEDGTDYKYRRKKHQSYRSSREGDNEEENGQERGYKYSRKKHRSQRSSYEDDEEQEDEHERDCKYSRKKHRSYHSSHEDDKQEDEDERDHKYSMKKHSSREQDNEDEEEERDQRRSRRKHRSHRSSHHSRDRRKRRKSHSSSKDREYRHQQKDDVSSDEERRHCSRADKHRKESHSEREELEEGEISSKISDQSRGRYVGDGASREASVDISSSYQDRRAPSQPSDMTGVSDDLRAKIRAMLMSTL